MKRALLVLMLASAGLSAAEQAPKKLLFLTHAALYKHTSLGRPKRPSPSSARPAASR